MYISGAILSAKYNLMLKFISFVLANKLLSVKVEIETDVAANLILSLEITFEHLYPL